MPLQTNLQNQQKTLSAAQRVKKEEREWFIASRITDKINKGFAIPISSFPSGVQQKIRAIWAGEERVKRAKIRAARKFEEETGGRFKPVFVGGKLTGFEDVEKGVSVGVGAIEQYVEKLQVEPVVPAKEPEFPTKPAKLKFLDKESKFVAQTKVRRGIGTAIVSAYAPPTKEEIKERKKAKLKAKFIKVKGKTKEALLKITSGMPTIDITTKYGSGARVGYRQFWETDKTRLKRPPALIAKKEIPARKTIEFRPATEEDYRRLQFIEEAMERKIRKTNIEESFKLQAIQEKLQEQINAGEISYDEAVKKLKKEQIKSQQKLQKKHKEIVEEAEKKIGKRQLGAKSVSAIATAGTYGFISKLAPPIGAMILGLSVTEIALKRKEIVEYAKKYPLSFGVQVGGGILGGFAGGFAGAKIRGKYILEPRIKNAITKSKVKVDYKQLKTTKEINKLQISPEGKTYLKNLIDEGYSLRTGTGKLLATAKTDIDYLPNVRLKFIEVIGRDGKIVDRINLGTFIASYKGKTFSRTVVSHATGKLNEGTGKYFTRTFISKAKGKFKPIEYYEFLETAETTGILKRGKIRAVKGEMKVELLKKVKKPKVGDMTKIYRFGKPTEQQISQMLKGLKGKPYGKGEFTYLGVETARKTKMLYGLGDITTKWQEIIGGKYAAEVGYGKAVFRRIIEKPKISKAPKPFDFSKFKVKVKAPPKVKAPKLKLAQKIVYVRKFPTQPSISTQALIYEQAYVSIPKLAKPSISGVGLRTFLLGGVGLKTRQKQLQVNLQKLGKTPKFKFKEMQLLKFQNILGISQMPKQAQLQEQMQIQALKQVQVQKLLTNIPAEPQVPPITIAPVGKVIPQIISPLEEYKPKRRKRKISKAELKQQLKKYQASVGAVLLGYEVSPEELKRLEKKTYTGLELRPIVKSKKLRKQQNLLLDRAIGTSRKGSPKKAVRQINKQYSDRLKKMLSYVKLDKKRSSARRKTGRKYNQFFNPIRQGKSGKKNILRRLQRVFGFKLIKKKQKKNKR
ncbi:MAG: hypothetical protein ACTSPV_01220 [Candidatus Hodarchaeales archaeon]